MTAPSRAERPPLRTLPDRAFGEEFLRLRAAAYRWIDPYYDGEHLSRAGDWLLQIAPDAPEPLIIAVLTHDMERSVPGGPTLDKQATAWDDRDYNREHCERSAQVVADWLRDQGASEAFVLGVDLPIREHEFGGSPEGDLAQAADSLSWLEVNARLAADWVRRGDCDLPKAVEKLCWMRDRIRGRQVRAYADELFDPALADLHARAARPPG